MDLENKVPIFWTDKNDNIIPFSKAARSATLRFLRKYHLNINKKEEDRQHSSIKFEPSNFDMFIFDDDIP